MEIEEDINPDIDRLPLQVDYNDNKNHKDRDENEEFETENGRSSKNVTINQNHYYIQEVNVQ